MIKLDSAEFFQITGRGTVASIQSKDLPENFLINVGDHIEIAGIEYRIRGIETTSVFGGLPPKFYGLLIKKVEKDAQNKDGY